MINYKQDPIQAAELVLEAINAMVEATSDDRFLDALNSTDNFPFAMSLDDQQHMVHEWLDNIREAYNWQEPTQDELVTAINQIDFSRKLLYGMFGGQYTDLASKLQKMLEDFDYTIESLHNNICTNRKSMSRIMDEINANMSESCEILITKYFEINPISSRLNIDRTSPAGKFKLLVSSLASLIGKMDYSPKIEYHNTELINLLKASFDPDEEQEIIEQPQFRVKLKLNGWVEENTGGGCMVWYKDFMCIDGIKRMVGINGESIDGWVYAVDYEKYWSDGGEHDYDNLEGCGPTFNNDWLENFQQIEIEAANHWIQLMEGFRI